MTSAKYEPHFYGPVQGVVIGDNNTVTIIFQSGEKYTAPFLAPPSPPYKLVGRDELLNDLKKRILGGKDLTLCALNGIPGVGKTALGIALANDKEVLTHYPDGVLWAGLGREPNVLNMLGKWGIALGIPTNEMSKLLTEEDRVDRIRIAIGTRRMLLVVDDAWQLELALYFQLGGINCAQLITTRFPEIALRFANEGVYTVHELNNTKGLELLARLAPKAIELELESAKELVRAVGGLPLSLIIVGNYLGRESFGGQPRRISQALERLSQVQERLQMEDYQHPAARHPSLPEGAKISLEAIIALSDEALKDKTRQALYSISVFPPKPNSFSEEAALAISTNDIDDLNILCDYGLVESSGQYRYTLHQSISDYSKLKFHDETAYHKMVRYFNQFVEAYQTNYNKLDSESNNILAALQIASDKKYHTEYAQGANAFYSYLHVRGLYNLAESLLTKAVLASRETKDNNGLFGALLNLGRMFDKRGEYVRAEEYYKEGLELAFSLEETEKVIVLLTNLGTIAFNTGNYTKADKFYEEGLLHAREANDQNRISALLMGLGAVADSRGDFSKAVPLYEESLSIAKKNNERELIPVILSNLSGIFTDNGDYSKAEKYLLEGLTLAREMGYRENISLLLSNLGQTAQKIGHYKQAREYYQEGLEIAREIGHPKRICILLTNLGSLLGGLDEYAKAEEYIQESLSLAREIGQRWDITAALIQLGELYLKQKKIDLALAAFNEAFITGQDIESKDLSADALFGLAKIEKEQGNNIGAIKKGKESLALYESIEHSKAEEIRNWLAELKIILPKNHPPIKSTVKG